MNNDIYDIVGVGVGPFNLSLACMTEPLADMRCIFFDKKSNFDWHSGIMLEWSTLQIPFIADLVTFADPTSQFSFLNYLKSQGLLYQHYIRENFFILRSEYNDYCQWAIARLNNVHFDNNVEKISYDEKSKIYTVETRNSYNVCTQVKARHIVLGTGTSPVLPDFCRSFKGEVHFSADYLAHKQDYKDKKSITIVGSGQSGAEIYYDLLTEIDLHQYQLNWITRSERFIAMDLGKLTLELTSPDYTNHFYNLPAQKRDEIIHKQAPLYKGINLTLINDIYDLLYIKSKKSGVATRLITNTQLNQIARKDDLFTLYCTKQDVDKDFTLESEIIILSLGYEYKIPECLYPIAHLLNWDNKERLLPNQDYTLNNDKNIFAQNIGLYTHGISAPDLGMGCYRNSIIINQILNREVYPVEQKICFQEFLPE
ncbi:lysine N(6)-hydroxylase/L-ornithine N(5)-oxygenase family protein [Pseudoalteromonas sp.]|uniref:lysine N(6)-hydroxylase/L-ornithine N(5)-oxygenase family protein n=1 Tax=unclassified Pseudoalteromonas TaxID=194690 RepID=UPI003F9DF1D4